MWSYNSAFTESPFISPEGDRTHVMPGDVEEFTLPRDVLAGMIDGLRDLENQNEELEADLAEHQNAAVHHEETDDARSKISELPHVFTGVVDCLACGDVEHSPWHWVEADGRLAPPA